MVLVNYWIFNTLQLCDNLTDSVFSITGAWAVCKNELQKNYKMCVLGFGKIEMLVGNGKAICRCFTVG